MKNSPLFLLKALDLAREWKGFCSPNPAVGAVIVDATNQIIATGYHTGPGNLHAEIDALQKLSQPETDATLYVTLEPCCHYGKTPPCTEAIIKSGIKRVVFGLRDPNPLISGKGEKLLKEAGIECEYHPLPEINSFYESYVHWHATQLPFVTAKLAMSLDGKIAGKKGERIQMTGEILTEWTHQQRKYSDAILTTFKTIQNDNPQLNARCENKIFPKKIYVLDTNLNISLESTIFKTAESITLFHSNEISLEKKFELEKLGARCISTGKNESGLNLHEVLNQIGRDGIHDLWVEAGGKCFSAFIRNKLANRALLYIAPRWLGEGLPAFHQAFSFPELNPASIHWQQMGDDKMLEIRL